MKHQRGELWVDCAIALTIAAAAFTGGWQVRTWKAGHDDAQRLEQEAHDAKRRGEKATAAATDYEAAKAAQRVKVVTVTREVERAIQADPGCSGQPIPDELRLALTRAAAYADQPIADRPMPAASAAGAFDLVRPRDRLLRGIGGAGGLQSAASGAR